MKKTIRELSILFLLAPCQSALAKLHLSIRTALGLQCRFSSATDEHLVLLIFLGDVFEGIAHHTPQDPH